MQKTEEKKGKAEDKTENIPTEEQTTHFGYETVNTEEKVVKVASVFHSVASSYDVMNDLMSLGIHRLWKRTTIEHSGVKQGQVILDLAGGTGDLSSRFSTLVGKKGRIVLSDINASMLAQGRDRLINEGLLNIEFVLANAEELPFPDNCFDCFCIAFGLRNVTNKDATLASIYRVLKPGGRLLVLEFSKPDVPGLAPIYDFYSFNILPKIGKVVANDEASYRYLAESIRMHPDQETLKSMMETAGFDKVSYLNMSGGIVALHKGFKF